MEAEPKSASFTCPGSVSKMFPALMSLSNTSEEIITAPHRRQDQSLRATQHATKHLITLTGESCCGSEGKPTLEEHHG